MNAYLSIIVMRFKVLLHYRMVAIAGIVTQFFWAMVKIMVLQAFYASTTASQSFSFTQAVTYIWAGQIFLSLLPLWRGDVEIQDLIRRGDVAYELCRPLNLYQSWYCRLIALRTAPMMLRAIPMVAIALFALPAIYSFKLPASSASLAAWIVTMIGALAVSCALSNIVTIVTLWQVAGEGIEQLMMALVMLFSGLTIPIPLFPDVIQPLVRALPFACLVDIPMRFYIGDIPAGLWYWYFAYQLMWTGILVGIGMIILRIGMKRVSIQGG